MWSDAFAQTPGAAAAPGNPAIAMLIQFGPIVIIFVIMYLLLIRPQQQRQKQLDTMLKAVKKGDRVVTSGGILGTVVGVDDAKAVLKIADDVKVEFTKSSIVQVLEDLRDTMKAYNGVGLAANQVGVAQRVLVVDVPLDDQRRARLALVNPVITAKSGSETGEEGCLSMPGIYEDVARATRVEVEA